MTPKAFIHKIHEICRRDLQHIVLPEVRPPRCAALMPLGCPRCGRPARGGNEGEHLATLTPARPCWGKAALRHRWRIT